MKRHHAIDYIEFTVSDMAAAQAFYANAFGWKFTPYGPDYAGIQDGDSEMGGFAVGEVRPGGVLVVLYSNALEDSESAVRAAGGEITKTIFSFPGGRRFHFRDPSGNEVAVWGDA